MFEIIISTVDCYLMFYLLNKFLDNRTNSKIKITLLVGMQAAVVVFFSTQQALSPFVFKLPMLMIMSYISGFVFDAPYYRLLLLMVSEATLIVLVELPLINLAIVLFNMPHDFIQLQTYHLYILGIFSRFAIFLIMYFLADTIKRLSVFGKKSSYQLSLVLMVNFCILFVTATPS